jgi:hypothetical protein
MSRTSDCIRYIKKVGVVSVFPSKTKSAPPSLWQYLHPRSKFSWVWDEAGDAKVVKLWWLKNEIAASKKVLYGRFFSNQPVFVSFKAAQSLKASQSRKPYSELESYILGCLESNSPQTLRMLKKQARLDQVDFLKNEWQRALVLLQKQFLISSLGDSTREKGPMPSTEYVSMEHFFDL